MVRKLGPARRTRFTVALDDPSRQRAVWFRREGRATAERTSRTSLRQRTFYAPLRELVQPDLEQI